ncbi:MAG: hypothetical protein WCH76_01430 [Candidatus Riflemargulisbacteria bacterium]
MHLKVSGSDSMIFDGEIYGFSTTAVDGKITFLDHHANYLTVLKKGELILIDKQKTESAPKKVTLREDSLLLIENNNAVIFC